MQIDSSGSAEGCVFRPTPDVSKVMTVVMGLFFIMFSILVFQGLSFKGMFTAELWWSFPAVFFVFFILFYYSFFIYWIGPVYVKKNIDNYFIYIGKEGIIRKESGRVALVPWEIITGVSVVFGVRGGGNYLELEIKGHQVWTPKLVRGANESTLFADWVEYSAQDMRAMKDIIQKFL